MIIAVTKRLLGYFLKGLLFSVPLIIAVYIILTFYSFFRNLFPAYHPITLLLIIFTLLSFIGFAISYSGIKRISQGIKNVLKKAPPLYASYSAIEKIISSVTDRKHAFRRPVFVTKENGDERQIGYVTKDNLSDIGLPEHSAVFIPQAFTLQGTLMIVSKKNLTPIKGNEEKIYTLILSGGLASSDIK